MSTGSCYRMEQSSTSIRSAIQSGESGGVAEQVGATVDMTERKRAEEALRRSEGYLTDAQRLSHTGS